MRIIFAGTPLFAKEILAVLNKHHDIIAVFCQPDRPQGRGRVLTSCAVKIYAREENLAIFQPQKLGSNELEQIKRLNADIMIVVAFGQILTKNILRATPRGCLNIHASLLPRWRGAAPIPRAIQAGDKKTGVCIVQMDEKLDTGDILLTLNCEITVNDTAQSLHDRLIILGQRAILDALRQIHQLKPQVQSKHGICYAHRLRKEEAWINWRQTAGQIYNQIRAFNPYPIAQSLVVLKQKNNHKIFKDQSLRIWEVQLINRKNSADKISISQDKTSLIIHTKQGDLSIKKVQLPSKKIIDIQTFNNNYQLLDVKNINTKN